MVIAIEKSNLQLLDSTKTKIVEESSKKRLRGRKLRYPHSQPAVQNFLNP